MFDGFAYLVLYNKYTGVLRVMTVGNQEHAYTGATITIEFDPYNTEKQTSLISNTSKIFALDQFEAAPSISAAMEYSNNAARWFFADFQMAYDPCTCLFRSTIWIRVNLIEQSFIKLTGSLTGTLVDINNKVGSIDPKTQGYSFKELGSAAIPAIQKAQKKYASVNKFVQAQFEALKTEGKTEAQLKAEGKLELANKVRSLNKFQTALKKSDFLKEGLKAAPYIGAAVELLDFFVSGGKKRPSPQEVKIMPMSIQADMRLEGYIITNNPFLNITVNTPGSKNVASRNEANYPLYNEVLGIFNLLHTPTVVYKEEGYFYSEPYITEEEYNAQYQLKDIQYVINPAAGFDLTGSEIWASLDFGDFATKYMPLNCLENVSIASGYYETNGYYSIIGCTDKQPKSIRFLLNLKRNDADANTQNVLLSVTYPINLVKDQNFNFSPDYCSWQNNLSFSNQTLSGTYLAWETITLGTNTVLQPGTVIQAPSIIVAQGVTIPQGVTLKLGIPTGCTDAGIVPASEATVTAFCNSSTYNNPARSQFRTSGVKETQAIPDLEEDKLFSIYPNPAQSYIVVELGETIADEAKVAIFNLTGVKIYDMVLKGGSKNRINLGNYPRGIYLIKINTDNHSYSRKIILE